MALLVRNLGGDGFLEARVLGRALADALHDDERAVLMKDLAMIHNELRLDGCQSAADMLRACLTALAGSDDEGYA